VLRKYSGGNVNKKGENVMKKFVGLVLVLCLAASASALDINGLRVAPDDQKDHYEHSDWITIELFLDLDSGELANSFVMDSLREGSPSPGTAASPALDTRWSSGSGGTLGTSPELVSFAYGAIISPDPDIEGVLWSMEYHVPDVPDSTWIEIYPYVSSAEWYFAEISITGAGGVSYTVPIDGLLIHVIPEPMTVALLGLGGLVALRRRKR
jgi:hypothetical protein